MGIYDRDYYRDDEPPFWARLATARAALALAATVLTLFVAEVLTAPSTAGAVRAALAAIPAELPPEARAEARRAVARKYDAPGKFCAALELRPDLVRAGQVWRAATAPFASRRDALVHVFAAVAVLLSLGARIEERAGWRKFLAFALLSALGGSAVKLMLAYGAGIDADLATSGPAALTTAVAVAAGRLFHRDSIDALAGTPVWLLAALLVGLDLLDASAENFKRDGHAAHLAGAVFGLAYAQFAHGGVSSRRPRRSLRVVPAPVAEPRPRAAETPARSADPVAGGGFDEQLEAKLDQVLEKVAKSGRASLTAEEQATLQRASEAIKRRQTRA